MFPSRHRLPHKRAGCFVSFGIVSLGEVTFKNPKISSFMMFHAFGKECDLEIILHHVMFLSGGIASLFRFRCQRRQRLELPSSIDTERTNLISSFHQRN